MGPEWFTRSVLVELFISLGKEAGYAKTDVETECHRHDFVDPPTRGVALPRRHEVDDVAGMSFSNGLDQQLSVRVLELSAPALYVWVRRQALMSAG